MSWEQMKPALLVLAIMIALLSIESAVSDVTSSGASSTQSNVSGSNTSIQGYEATTNNTYQGQVTNSTTNSTSNSTNQRTAANSASAPSISSYSQESCFLVITSGFSVVGLSFSGGGYIKEDKGCTRRKNAAVMAKLGMKISAIALMTQDENVWQSMMDGGTPPPIDGLIGDQARARWEEVGGFHRTKQYQHKSGTSKTVEDKVDQYRKYKESLNENNNTNK